MVDITSPNAQAYGTYEQALAQMLQGGGPVAGPLNQLALNSYARQQRGQYGQDLQRTQMLQAQQAEAERLAALQETYLQQIAPMATAGVVSAIDPSQFNIEAVLGQLETSDANRGDVLIADALKNRSSAIANMADVGLLPGPEGTGQILYTGAPQNIDDGALLPYTTPDARNDALRAAAAQTTANASMVRANRPSSSDEYTTITDEEYDPETGNTRRVTRRVRNAQTPQAQTPAPAQAPGGSRSAEDIIAEFRANLRANRQAENRQ